MLELCHLTKRYGSLEALHDLSFTVREGEIFGFVGANGAGKTGLAEFPSVPTARPPNAPSDR